MSCAPTEIYSLPVEYIPGSIYFKHGKGNIVRGLDGAFLYMWPQIGQNIELLLDKSINRAKRDNLTIEKIFFLKSAEDQIADYFKGFPLFSPQ